MKITHLTILFLLLSIFTSYGQEDCATKLSKAQKQYDAGQIEEIQQMLQPCIKDGFTKEEIQTAQKLIIQTNVFDKNNKAADSAMLQFLKKYPEYEIVPSDQAEFVQLFETYQTKPVASVGGIIGINYCNVTKGEIANEDAKPEYAAPSFAINAGLSFRKPVSNKFDISIDLLYQQNKYQSTLNWEDTINRKKDITTFSETQTYFAVPVSVIYSPLVFEKVSIFARGGATVGYMLGSSANVTSTNVSNEKSNLIITDYRKPLQIWLLFGLGATFNLPHSFLQLDLRYNYGGFMQQAVFENSNPKGISTDILENDYGYVQNGFALSNLAINIGFYYKFYSPRKK